MRVRQCAVVGAALVAAWAGSAGVAQATDGGSEPSTCEELALSVASESGTPDTDPCSWPVDECDLPTIDSVEGTDPCSVEVTVVVDGDCEDPETLFFSLEATGLEPDQDYEIAFASDGFTVPEGSEEDPGFLFPFTTDEAGDAAEEFTATEGAVQVSSDGFTVEFLVLTDDESWEPAAYGEVEVGGCETEPATPTTQPAAPTTPVATPTVVPVVVTPVAAHPAVLANTGTPVTSAAVLGGGLLLAGAGALVGARRRSS